MDPATVIGKFGIQLNSFRVKIVFFGSIFEFFSPLYIISSSAENFTSMVKLLRCQRKFLRRPNI